MALVDVAPSGLAHHCPMTADGHVVLESRREPFSSRFSLRECCVLLLCLTNRSLVGRPQAIIRNDPRERVARVANHLVWTTSVVCTESLPTSSNNIAMPINQSALRSVPLYASNPSTFRRTNALHDAARFANVEEAHFRRPTANRIWLFENGTLASTKWASAEQPEHSAHRIFCGWTA
jgi:hypothetical protein